MLKIITFLLIFASMLYADVENYLIGLNAYKDGFDKLAAENLESYLETPENVQRAQFARYLLYKINLQNNNYGKAYEYFEKIEDIRDKRFDRKQMSTDKMDILLNIDCSKASEYVGNKAEDNLASFYLQSQCPINDKLAGKIAESNISDKIKAAYIIKLEDKIPLAYNIAKNISFDNLPEDTVKYIGLLFYQNNRFDIFWKAYKYYKNDQFVNIALQRAFETENYKDFNKSFSYNEPKFNITNTNYCRAIKSRMITGKTYECSWIDKCYENKNKEYINAKFTCLMENKSKKTTAFIKNYIDAETDFFCSQAGSIFKAGYYDSDMVAKFKTCSNKYELANLLLSMNKPEQTLILLKNDNSDKSLYIKAKSHILAGNAEKAKQTAEEIKDQNLKNSLFEK